MLKTMATFHHLNYTAFHQFIGVEGFNCIPLESDAAFGDLAAFDAKEVRNRFQSCGFASPDAAQERNNPAFWQLQGHST